MPELLTQMLVPPLELSLPGVTRASRGAAPVVTCAAAPSHVHKSMGSSLLTACIYSGSTGNQSQFGCLVQGIDFQKLQRSEHELKRELSLLQEAQQQQAMVPVSDSPMWQRADREREGAQRADELF